VDYSDVFTAFSNSTIDLTLSCPSWDTNSACDIVPTPGPTAHLHPVVMYLGDGLEEYLTHPYASPLFGKFDGLPPLLIQCGEAEVLRDEIMLLSHKASLAGVHVQHEMYEDAVSVHTLSLSSALIRSQVHVFQAFPFLGSANEAFVSCREFVRHRLPELQASTPKILDNICEARLDGDIDNENVRVVRGDGVETSAGRRDMEVQMKHGRLVDQNLPSWGLTCPPRDTISTGDSTDIHGESANSAAAYSHSPSGLRRIKSTLSVLVADAPFSKVSEYTHLGGPHSRPNFSITSAPSQPPSPRLRKTSSYSSVASFVEQWSLSQNSCSISHQAQVTT
jgi:hypothetical protein